MCTSEQQMEFNRLNAQNFTGPNSKAEKGIFSHPCPRIHHKTNPPPHPKILKFCQNKPNSTVILCLPALRITNKSKGESRICKVKTQKNKDVKYIKTNPISCFFRPKMKVELTVLSGVLTRQLFQLCATVRRRHLTAH